MVSIFPPTQSAMMTHKEFMYRDKNPFDVLIWPPWYEEISVDGQVWAEIWKKGDINCTGCGHLAAVMSSVDTIWDIQSYEWEGQGCQSWTLFAALQHWDYEIHHQGV